MVKLLIVEYRIDKLCTHNNTILIKRFRASQIKIWVETRQKKELSKIASLSFDYLLISNSNWKWWAELHGNVILIRNTHQLNFFPKYEIPSASMVASRKAWEKCKIGKGGKIFHSRKFHKKYEKGEILNKMNYGYAKNENFEFNLLESNFPFLRVGQKCTNVLSCSRFHFL